MNENYYEWLDKREEMLCRLPWKVHSDMCLTYDVSLRGSKEIISNWVSEHLVKIQDKPLEITCDNCGYYIIDEKDMKSLKECPKCDSNNLIHETCHMGIICPICNQKLEEGDILYRVPNSSKIICPKCINKLMLYLKGNK